MMETPKGRRVKMTKLGGPRWRLEMGVHQIFISKEGPGTARLEHLNEDLIGNYPVWDQAMGEALRMFDKWEDATMPPPETVDEAAEEAAMTLLIQKTLDTMAPLESKLEVIAPLLGRPIDREELRDTDWKIVIQAVKFTKTMLSHNAIQQKRLGESR
jgi:hypothetical protein